MLVHRPEITLFFLLAFLAATQVLSSSKASRLRTFREKNLLARKEPGDLRHELPASRRVY
jgi:hypothetical protein